MIRKFLSLPRLCLEFIVEIRRLLRRGSRAVFEFLVYLFGWLIDWETTVARLLKAIASPVIWAFEYCRYYFDRLLRRYRAWLDVESLMNSTKLDFERDQAKLKKLEAHNARQATRQKRGSRSWFRFGSGP